MNPENFKIERTPAIPEHGVLVSPESTQENTALDEFDVYASDRLNEALEIKNELVPLREQRKAKGNKGESSEFDFLNSRELALKQSVQLIIAKALELEELYGQEVEIPDFDGILGEENLNEIEVRMRKAQKGRQERKAA